MQKKDLLKLNLQLFAEGGAAAGGEGGAAPAQTSESALSKAETKAPGRSRRGKTGEQNVVYGRQDAVEAGTTSSAAGSTGEGNTKTGVTTTSNTLEDRRKAYRDLTEGEYKDIHTEEMQKTINRRFKETKGMEATIAAQKPILDILMQKYKIGDGDMAKLQTAIENDTRYWEAAAEEAGLTVEQYKAMQKLERENEELKRIRQRQQGQERMNQQLANWQKQAEGVKELYPTFDFKTEASNRDFLGLLRSGLDVQKAYELMHMDEIKEAVARSAAQTAGAQVEARIKSKAARPSENGTSSQSAAIVKSDVHNLNRKDRANVARDVLSGKKVSF